MEMTNSERVDRALDLLRDGLAPACEDAWQRHFGNDWLRQVNSRLQGPERYPTTKDPAFLFKGIKATWDDVFRRRFRPFVRSLVFEVSDARNRWAHKNTPMSDDDTLRAPDSMERMLDAFGNGDERELIRSLRRDLMRQTSAQESRSERRGIAAKPTESTSQARSEADRPPMLPRAAGRSPSPSTCALPDLVVHADWSARPRNRWCAIARLESDGRYQASAPEPVGSLDTYFRRLHARTGQDAVVLAGFDFPIGLPARYAAMVGLTDFRSALSMLGRDQWRDFYRPAESRADISLGRPFYPNASGRAGEHKRSHLLSKLKLQDMRDLKRRCERQAESLFWLIGPKQVGKAAISGWKDLLAPALENNDAVSIWPFDGTLGDLLKRPGLVVAETYPAEMYRHLGLEILKGSKKRQPDRAADAPTMRAWALSNGISLAKRLEDQIKHGFGSEPGGDDRFDATVGLFGMLNIVLGNLASGEPRDETTQIEGWMLGCQLTP